MISLELIRTNIQRILTVFAGALHAEAAVFDRHYQLLACTPNYLKHKGRQVHTPSLQDVFTQGTVVFNKPGHMPSCAGCRFKDECPSTVEILSLIKVDNDAIGIISLTSFTSEGQKRISKHSERYLETLAEVSELIAAMAVQKNAGPEFMRSDPLRTITDQSQDYFFLIDDQGSIVHCNAAALQLFPQCSGYPDFLERLLPEKLMADILAGQRLIGKAVKSDTLTGAVASTPIMNHHKLAGALVQIVQSAEVRLGAGAWAGIHSGDALDSIKGDSEVIQKLKAKVRKIANSRSAVLITGETGTGKELFAKAVHGCGNRSAGPFMSINCASIPENLLESELFGYEEGAFTGAKKGGKPGRFELASGGTLFLDEIGEMPIHMQAKLLRVLQDYKIMRVGGTQPVPIDVRVVAATNQQLPELIRKGQFRADLFYRLNVIPLDIPPLRQRSEDIGPLALHFLRKHSRQLRGFDQAVNALFRAYAWPGNVRELENAVEYAVNMETGEVITPDNLPVHLLGRTGGEAEFKVMVRETEVAAIKKALDKYGWDVDGKRRAARELGIGLRTLYRKLQEMA